MKTELSGFSSLFPYLANGNQPKDSKTVLFKDKMS